MEHIRLTENNIRAIGSSRHICRDAIEDQYPVIVIICDKEPDSVGEDASERFVKSICQRSRSSLVRLVLKKIILA